MGRTTVTHRVGSLWGFAHECVSQICCNMLAQASPLFRKPICSSEAKKAVTCRKFRNSPERV